MKELPAVGTLVLLACLVACHEKTEVIDTGGDEPTDLDGDGYGVPVDCNDQDASIHPGADEYCNGEDDDCDGITDEEDALDASTWYLDGDGDGYGDAATSTVTCYAPSGYLADSSDCDDARAASNPGADEYCNGEDDDCDGATDEDDAVDTSTWYLDGDGDGYGDATVSTVTCQAPSGYLEDSSDCDDARAESNPGADEYCNGEDDDCDGITDEDDALDASTWHLDGDGDGYGDAATSTVTCYAPSGYLADSCCVPPPAT